MRATQLVELDAVLEGAPALLTAVDRRAIVTIAASAQWRLTAREIGIDRLVLGPGGSLPPDLDTAMQTRLGLFDAVRRAIEVHAPDGEPLDVIIDSAAFLHDGH